MISCSNKRSVWTLLLPLGMIFCLAGCQTIQPTRTAATDQRIAADVCKAWTPVTYSRRDTPETQTEARANNAARAAYCKGG